MPASKPHGSPTRLVLAVAVVAALLAPFEVRAQPATAKPVADAGSTAALDQARAALDKYRDPIMAVHDGYFSTLGCISYPNGGGGEGMMPYKPGGMGVHFLNLQNIGPTLDPAKPQVLIYEPVGEKLSLVAAEWFVPVEVAGSTPPSIFGKPLEGPMVGHAPIMPDGLHHYDLHVWLWKDNPLGRFSPTNPAVKCPKGSYSFEESGVKMAHPKH